MTIKRWIRSLLLFFMALSLLGTVPALCKDVDEKVVIVEGKAEGTSIKAEDEAMNDALRNAVEQGVGVFVDSQTIVQEYKLIGDEIYIQAKGYVRSYQILKTMKEKGLTRVTIRAVVGLTKLKYDLMALNLIKTLKGDPRIMVTISEIVDGRLALSHTAEIELEKILLARNLNLVDKSRVDINKARDVALNYNDYQRAAAFGYEIGAEIVVTGQVLAEYSGVENLYGSDFHFYSCLLELRVVRSDTARLLIAESLGPFRKGASTRLGARSMVVKVAVEKVGEKFLDKLFEQWRQEVVGYNRILLTIVGIDSEDILQNLEANIRNFRGIKNLFRRSYLKDVAMLEVDFEGDCSLLASRFSNIKDLSIKVIGTTQNRIDLEIE